MKKLFFALIIMLLAIPAFAAPTQKGNFVITLPLVEWSSAEGDLYENAEGDGWTYLSLGALGYQAQIEWFVIDGLAIGGVLGYESAERGDYSITATTIGPMVSYYFQMDQLLIPYAGIGYIYQTWEDDDGVTTDEGTSTTLRLKLGLAYMLGNNLSLFGEFSYDMDEEEPDGGESVDGTAMTITAGIKAFF
ncbi:MAG: porin family protein [Spirochaetes bacterium]|nr:porin family protein [Spirochaetota bacterium]